MIGNMERRNEMVEKCFGKISISLTASELDALDRLRDDYRGNRSAAVGAAVKEKDSKRKPNRKER